MFKISVNVCPDNRFSTAEPLAAILGVMIHHRKLEHHTSYIYIYKLGCCLQGQG